MYSTSRRVALGVAALVSAPAILHTPLVATSAVAQEKPSCSSFSSPVLERVNPRTGTSSLTLDAAGSDSTTSRGFTSVRDAALLAAPRSGPGLVGVHRLELSSTADVVYSVDAAEWPKLTAKGYVDRGVAFYAAPHNDDCVVSVQRWRSGELHRFTATNADAAALAATGWTREATPFYLRPAPVDPTFSIAVIPDTQQEVGTDKRFRNRSEYLVANRQKLDLRFVTHTGDVVNWDTPDHAQYKVAQDAMRPLEAAGIPYSMSIGNHDSMATGPGGGARDSRYTRQLFRDTRTFNDYLDNQGLDQEGAYEPGKVDNTYHVFTAGGVSWLVLNLEMWPRPGAVTWAEKVVATHPKHNVIIATHYYLTSGGRIAGEKGYGDTSAADLSKRLVKKYANVRLVFSGHTGTTAHRVDKGVHGNRIDSFLLNWTSNDTNRTRLVSFDTKKKSLTTWVYAPYTKTSYPKTKIKVTRLKLVR